jgi:threonine aldolase
VRKRLGGWMRQAGVLAAAGLYALERNVERLAEDHALARSLAHALHGLGGFVAPPEELETNIALVRIEGGPLDAAGWMEALKPHGVLVLPMTARSLRFVTHLDVGEGDVERLARAVRSVLGAR